MDRMLKDEAYRSELDALRRRGDGAPEAGAGGPRGGGEPADADEEDGPVSTTEALNMLRQARARRRARGGAGDGSVWGRARGGALEERGAGRGTARCGAKPAVGPVRLRHARMRRGNVRCWRL